MVPISNELIFLFLGLLVTITFFLDIIFALILNLFLKRPFGELILSTGVVAMIGALIANGVIYVFPGQVAWVNLEPQTVKSVLWDNSIVLCIVGSSVGIAFWQIVARHCRKARQIPV